MALETTPVNVEKIITTDRRYAIIAKDFDHYIDYTVFEVFSNYAIEEILDTVNVDNFLVVCKEHEIDSQVNMIVKWDGCVNMDSQTDGIRTHFCEIGHIDSFHVMMTTCYNHADNKFKFN